MTSPLSPEEGAAPFQIDGGLMRLLDAYPRAGGISLEPARVHFHELCLVAGWYRESLESPGAIPRIKSCRA